MITPIDHVAPGVDAIYGDKVQPRNTSQASGIEMTNCKHTTATVLSAHHASRLAHDMRSPLTVILEFTSILRDGLGGPITQKQHEFLAHIESAAGDLSRMVDQRLDPIENTRRGGGFDDNPARNNLQSVSFTSKIFLRLGQVQV